MCWVTSAIGDSTVTAGAALYLYKNATDKWSKVSETESMDLTLLWANIQNKPTATVTNIDKAANLLAAVTTSSTELEYVKGTTSNIQTQLNSKAANVNATASAAGLMSAADKTKLDGVEAGANKYIHPTSGAVAGTYDKVTIDTNGHATSGTNLTAVQKLSETGITLTAAVVNGLPDKAAEIDAIVLGTSDTVPSNLRPGAIIVRFDTGS